MKLSKRIFTLFLCAVMIMTLLPFSAMAEDFSAAEEENPTAESAVPSAADNNDTEETAPAISDGAEDTAAESAAPEEVIVNDASLAAAGDCGEDGSDLSWAYSNGILTISGSGYMADYSSTQAPWMADYSGTITKVIICAGVLNISSYAFSGCTGLKEVTLPDTIQQIRSYAFAECSNLSIINLPESLTGIGIDAFSGCSSLETITVPNLPFASSWKYAFENSGLKNVTLSDGMSTIAAGAFSNCVNLKEITWASGLTTIQDGAFQKTGFESITVPEGVTSLGRNAFYSCAKLESITLPESLTSIPDYAFRNAALKNVVFSKGVSNLGNYIFMSENDMADEESSNVKLESVTFKGDAPTSFGAYTFYGVTITAYYPAGNTTWTSSALQNYGGSVTWKMYIPEGTEGKTVLFSGSCGDAAEWKLTADGELVIYGTGDMDDYSAASSNPAPWDQYKELIKTVTVESGVTSVGSYAFHGYDVVTTVSLADTVTKIGQNAFSQTSITEITIPAASVGAEAFYRCTALQTVTMTSTTLNVGSEAFYGCAALKTVNLPTGSTEIGSRAFAATGIEQITLPEGITRINTGVFADCTQLYKVTLPDSLQYIGTNAFANTRIEKITIPAGVSEIANLAFTSGSVMSGDDAEYDENNYLKEIKFEGDYPEVMSVYAFGGLTITAYYPSDNSTWYSSILLSYGGTYVLWSKDYTFKDFLLLKQYLAGSNASVSGKVDVNGDGSANLKDLLELKLQLAEDGEI